MKKVLLGVMIIGLGMFVTGCEEKTTSEKLKDNTVKEAELIQKSVSENADKVGEAIQKEVDALKK